MELEAQRMQRDLDRCSAAEPFRPSDQPQPPRAPVLVRQGSVLSEERGEVQRLIWQGELSLRARAVPTDKQPEEAGTEGSVEDVHVKTALEYFETAAQEVAKLRRRERLAKAVMWSEPLQLLSAQPPVSPVKQRRKGGDPLSSSQQLDLFSPRKVVPLAMLEAQVQAGLAKAEPYQGSHESAYCQLPPQLSPMKKAKALAELGKASRIPPSSSFMMLFSSVVLWQGEEAGGGAGLYPPRILLIFPTLAFPFLCRP